MKVFPSMISKSLWIIGLCLSLTSCSHTTDDSSGDNGDNLEAATGQDDDGIDHSSYDPEARDSETKILNEEETLLLAKDGSPDQKDEVENATVTDVTNESAAEASSDTTKDALDIISQTTEATPTAEAANDAAPMKTENQVDPIDNEIKDPEPIASDSTPSANEIKESTPVASSTTALTENHDGVTPGHEQSRPSMKKPSVKKHKKINKTPHSEELTSTAEPADNSLGVYVVQPGETLGTIAKKIYGSSKKWRQLVELNQLTNVNRIFPGDEIKFQLNRQTSLYAKVVKSLQKKEYKVEEGDTLAKIAEKTFGQKSGWKSLWAQNKAKISNPNHIHAGIVISYLDPRALDEALKEAHSKKTASLQH